MACFVMGEAGHVQRMRVVVDALMAAGADVRVWSDARFAAPLSAAGATFVDLFAGRPLDAVDDRSRPVPSRFVTFAGVHGEALAREVATWGAALVVFDGFAAVGHLVARLLGLPHVTVLPGHGVRGAPVRAALATDPRVDLDPRCHAAVARLRALGWADASPFSYVADPSPWLNLHGEPDGWLGAAERAAFAPLACVGALTAQQLADGPSRPAPDGRVRVYASFGTVVWRYFADRALGALAAVARAFDDQPDATLLISLGGARLSPDAVAPLYGPRVTVASYVDQWQVLGACDLFITHQGLASTHEAVARGVPMVSLPFFWDQPALAARCAALGLAVALPGPVPTAAEVAAALATVAARRAPMAASLAAARHWEEQAVAQRGAVAARVLALARGVTP